MVATIRTPMSSVVACSLTPPMVIGPMKSGMKPADKSWNSAGNGPTERPPSKARQRPLNTSMPASVTMKDGIFI